MFLLLFFSFFKFPSRDSFHLLPSCVGTAEENDLLQLFTQSFATLKLCLTATLCLTVPPAWRRSAWTVRGEAPQQVSKQCRSLSLPSSRLRCQPNVNWDHRAARLYRSLTSTKSDWWWSSVTYTISDSGQVSFFTTLKRASCPTQWSFSPAEGKLLERNNTDILRKVFEKCLY